MLKIEMLHFIKAVIKNMPVDWLNLTTHRLDIYEEKLAKIQFLDSFEKLYLNNISSTEKLSELPTAYDYIRLGHPLSCVLEWLIAQLNKTKPDNVITFSSQSIAVLAILRKNALDNKQTKLFYSNSLPESLDFDILKDVYNYSVDVQKIASIDKIPTFDGSTIYINNTNNIVEFSRNENVDFSINYTKTLGSALLINKDKNTNYISAVQHVRRRETIAMTPINCLEALKAATDSSHIIQSDSFKDSNKEKVIDLIKKITGSNVKTVVGSSGLSIQYSIMMGLVDYANENYPGKAIKFIVPTNCYGGTNDQARRLAESIDNVEIIDLHVDGKNDMVESIHMVLNGVATEDAVPYIIAEIPTNPRVEVPDLLKLKEVLSEKRKTSNGELAIDPVFILDQTFCPNVHFLEDKEMLSSIRTIAYISGSKFPSGGKCTAGFAVGNRKSQNLMDKVALHLELCDNEATSFQYQILAQQLPSMNQRIQDAYKNTREFVTFIEEKLPSAKINFVSETLAAKGFTPSVFSLDLPTKGNTPEEKEIYKRAMNHKLIKMMISEIPDESKYCVSYGQLKGCYWTIPATSTQGTTKEGDKDYIARVSLSSKMDLNKHKQVFEKFIGEL